VGIRAALVVNPTAGQGRAKKILPEVKRLLQIGGLDLSIFRTEGSGDATLLARRALGEGCERVIVLGGDGTISEAINGLAVPDGRQAGRQAGLKAALGVVSAGTGEVFAAEMGLPTDPVEACRVIVEGKVRKIDLGRADGRHFVLMAGIGFDAQVVKEVKPEVKRMLKDLAYVLTGIKTLLTYKPTLMRIVLDDGKAIEGYFAVVGNARYYAGRYFSVATQASIDDGWLDVCVFKKGDIASFVRYLTGVLLRRHLDYSDVQYFRTKALSVESLYPVLVQADGELIGQTPMRFSVIPRALSVIVP